MHIPELIVGLIAICTVHTCYLSEDGTYLQIDSGSALVHPDDTTRYRSGDEVIVIVPKGAQI